MMTEAEIKDMIAKLEKQREQILANLNATDGALTAYRSVIDPSIIKQAEQPTAQQQ